MAEKEKDRAMSVQTDIAFGRNPLCPLKGVSGTDGSLTLKDSSGSPLLTLSLDNGCYRLRLENVFDLDWGTPRAKIEHWELLVIREALKLVKMVDSDSLTRENVREMVEATGEFQPALALRLLEARDVE